MTQCGDNACSHSWVVSILDPPDVSVEWVNNTDHVTGEHGEIICQGKGFPDTYNYTRFVQTVNGVQIRSQTTLPTTYADNEGYTIDIDSLSIPDTGVYECHVNNGIQGLTDSVDQVAYLTVKVKGIYVFMSMLFLCYVL